MAHGRAHQVAARTTEVRSVGITNRNGRIINAALMSPDQESLTRHGYMMDEVSADDAPRPARRHRHLVARDGTDQPGVMAGNPEAQKWALAPSATRVIGLVIPDLTNPFFGEYSGELERLAHARGFALMAVDSALIRGRQDAMVRRLLSANIDGLLLAPTDDQLDWDYLRESTTPIVLLNRTQAREGVFSIGLDFYSASRLAVEHLVGHGLRNVALLSGHIGGGVTSERERGWRDALAGAGLSHGRIERDEFTRHGGYAAGKRLVDMDRKPAGIFVISDVQAIGLLHAIHEAGLRVPEDIAVVGFDGSAETQYCWPPVTAIQQPTTVMAEAAFSALDAVGRLRPSHQQFSAGLVIRKSCGC